MTVVRMFTVNEFQLASNIQCLLGRMVSTMAALPLARLSMHPLQLWFLSQYRPELHPRLYTFSILRPVISSVQLWLLSEDLRQGISFGISWYEVTLTTNVSLMGWSAYCKGFLV